MWVEIRGDQRGKSAIRNRQFRGFLSVSAALNCANCDTPARAEWAVDQGVEQAQED